MELTRPLFSFHSIRQHSPLLRLLQKLTQRLAANSAVQLFGVVLAIGFCLWIISAAGAFGLSRLFSRYAAGMQSLPAAQRAAQLTPTDPESHLAGAEALTRSGQFGDAILELERSAALRPSDYSLWLNLGVLRDQSGDRTAALSAFDEAVKRAPFYAEPRWQRGNALLRGGRYDEAFKDLNQAARSEPALIPNLIDLAWAISKGDTRLTENLAQINTERLHLAFAKLLARRGKPTEAIEQVRAARNIPVEVRRELVELLLTRDAFAEAYEISRSGQETEAKPTIQDGGFEAPLTFDLVGFGWRVARSIPAITLGVDSAGAHSGSRSLKVEFKGDSMTEPPFISQLILVEPSRRYRINFAARSQDLVTGSLPIMVVKEAIGARRKLGQSVPLSKGSQAWQVSSFEFETSAETSAVFVGLQREPCASAPCPAFGAVWLDSFSMERLDSVAK